MRAVAMCTLKAGQTKGLGSWCREWGREFPSAPVPVPSPLAAWGLLWCCSAPPFCCSAPRFHPRPPSGCRQGLGDFPTFPDPKPRAERGLWAVAGSEWKG